MSVKHSAPCPVLSKHLIDDKYYLLKSTISRTEFHLCHKKRHKQNVRGINKQEMTHSEKQEKGRGRFSEVIAFKQRLKTRSQTHMLEEQSSYHQGVMLARQGKCSLAATNSTRQKCTFHETRSSYHRRKLSEVFSLYLIFSNDASIKKKKPTWIHKLHLGSTYGLLATSFDLLF